MKEALLICVLVLTGCSTVPRPDLGTTKVAGDTYIAEEKTCLGKPTGSVVWKRKPTKLDKVSEQVGGPAKVVLQIAIPVGLVATAMLVGFMTFLTPNPRLMKLTGTIAGLCLVVCALAWVWLLASAWPLIIIPAIIVLIVVLYRKTKGKSLGFLSVQ